MGHVLVVGRDWREGGASDLHVVSCSCGFRQLYVSLEDCGIVARAHWAEYGGGMTQGSNNEREGV